MSSTPRWIPIAASVVLASAVVGGIVFMTRGSGGSEPAFKALDLPVAPVAAAPPPPVIVSEDPIPTAEPDTRLANFGFEPLDKPLFVPDTTGKLVRKPAGNPPYKLVQCGTGAYSLRWAGRYLTVYDPNKLTWEETRREPDSCFTIVPGNCGGDKYVMLRSKHNKMFVRYDKESLALVCKDIPTARTSLDYCWKLQADEYTGQPCGCQYSYDLQRVVCTDCNVKKTPQPGASCSTVTAGYRAECCKGSQQDAFCKAHYFPDIVGRSLKEAMLYLRTRRPDLTLQPCPAPCAVSAYPTPTPGTVVIPYDPRTSLVTAPARILV